MQKTFKVTDEGYLIVTVDCGKEDYQPFVLKAQQLLAENVQVKGFRKGKAPFAEAIKYVKVEDIYNKMINLLVKSVNKSLLEGAPSNVGVSLIVQPSVSVRYDEKKDIYTLVYQYVSTPTVTLGKTKGLKVTAKKKSITSKDIDEVLEGLSKEQGVISEKEDGYKAQLGDIVSIDAIGYVDNHSFEGGNLKNYELELGTHTFVGDFEDQLVGVCAGDEKGVDIVFPENYIADLANKPAHFDVKVLSVKSKVYPKIDDELAKSDTTYNASSLKELKEKIKESLVKKEEQEYSIRMFNEIIDLITKDSKVVINSMLVDYEINARVAQRLNEIRKLCYKVGVSINDYYKLTNTSEDAIRVESSATAEEDIKRVAIFDELCIANGITITNEDLDNAAKENSYYASVLDDYRKNPTNSSSRAAVNNIIRQLSNNKLMEILLKDNPVVSKVKAEDGAEVKEVAEEKKPAAKKASTAKPKTSSTAKKTTASKKEEK